METDINELYINVLNVTPKSKNEFDLFIQKYNNNKQNLCIDKKTNKRIVSLEKILRIKESDSNPVFDSNPVLEMYKEDEVFKGRKILYIYKKITHKDVEYSGEFDKIEAFAVLDINDNKFVTLTLLCSSKIGVKIGNKPLGVYLLDLIYDVYCKKQKYILKIHPATDKLIFYYLRWKPPILPMEMFHNRMTLGYLIYAINIDIIYTHLKIALNSTNKKDVYFFIGDFNNITTLENYIPEIKDIKCITIEEYKENVKSKINELYFHDNRMNQLMNILDSCNVCNLKQFKAFITKSPRDSNLKSRTKSRSKSSKSPNTKSRRSNESPR